MNKRVDLKAATSTAIPAVVPTRKDLLKSILGVFKRQGETMFRAIPDIEFKADGVIEVIPTTDTIMQTVVDVLNAANIPTEPNLGSVMRNLELSRHDVHELACECKGKYVSGKDLVVRVGDVIRGH